ARTRAEPQPAAATAIAAASAYEANRLITAKIRHGSSKRHGASTLSADARDRGQRPAQGLRKPRGGPGGRLHDRGGGGLRAPRAERRRQDDDRRDPRGLPEARRRRGARALPRSREARAGLPRADRRRAAAVRPLA